MDDQDYTYQFDDAALAAWNQMFTSRQGDGGGDPEEDFLSAVTMAAACKAGGDFLDVGSGFGRIIERVRPYARRVTGLEPDRDRFLDCEKGFARDDGVEVFNLTSQAYAARRPDRRFDLVTVSMVVQHVSTRGCRQILADVRRLLARHGVALVATTHFYEERFTYASEPLAHDQATFDAYAEDTAAQDKGIPVRQFSEAAFRRELEQAGLEVVAWRQFAYPRPERAAEVAALFAAPLEQVRERGVSQYALVRAAAGPAAGGWLRGLVRRSGA